MRSSVIGTVIRYKDGTCKRVQPDGSFVNVDVLPQGAASNDEHAPGIETVKA